MSEIYKTNRSDNMINSIPLPSMEVEKVTKGSTQQAQRINASSEHIVSLQLKGKDDQRLAPILRLPVESKRITQRIDFENESQFKTKSFSTQKTKTGIDEHNNNKGEIDQNRQVFSHVEEKKDNIQVNKKNDYDENKETQFAGKNVSHSPSFISAPSESKKSNKDYDFLFLQLSYQNIIHQNVLDRIKDPDKLEYYMDKLDRLSKGINGLRDDFRKILNEIKNNKDALVDYWMEIFNQIKNNNFKTEEDVYNFLKNKNIPKSLINELLSDNIKSKSDMESLLKKTFPFLNLPNDISNISLDDLDKLYNQLFHFFEDAFKYMPDVSLSEDKINKITSHTDELKALINKKENESIKTKLEKAKEVYRELTVSQSALELEIMSDTLSGMALLTFLLAKTRELTLKVMLQRSEGEQKLFDEMQDVTEKSLKDKIEDQKAQIKKQEEIQFWAGIGLKILGGLLTLVAGIASVFTAGASMALMGIAVALFVADVALTVADEVYQAVNNKSFMDEIMGPISEAVMSAIDSIVDFLADALNSTLDVLKNIGLEKIVNELKAAIQDKIKIALKILITTALFVAAIGLSFIVGSAANAISGVAKKIVNQQMRDTLKKVLHDSLEAMLGKMIKEIIIETFEKVMEKINKLLAKEISDKALTMLNRTVVVSKLVNSTAINTVNIYSTTISTKILQSIADSKKIEAILNLIQKLMDKIMESYHENIDAITEILKNMSQQSSISNKAKSDMIRNMSF
ncbi:type III secretion system translocon subunit SctE [Proteus vulgaris]|uniref:type III secretion system translocon subunit SctE n=1 Tax=Proteus vulgaris TaxID=585 RepID=UPI000659FC79|nr:type III secretion system translocon subunit SctE [Proteus vulgaris]CRL61788.1 Translocator protein BipB [Proteus vulgaris]